MEKSQIAKDCDAGYTLKQAVKRSVARDRNTRMDLQEMYRNGWRVSKKMQKFLDSVNSAPEGVSNERH